MSMFIQGFIILINLFLACGQSFINDPVQQLYAGVQPYGLGRFTFSNKNIIDCVIKKRNY